MSHNTSPDGNVYPTSIPQNAWFIHFENYIIHAEGIEPPIPSLSRGESGTFSFWFYTRHYQNQDPPNPPTHLERYERLLTLNENGGSYIINGTVGNRQTFMQQIPDSAESILVKLEPSYDTRARGVWALVDGVEDATTMEHEVVQLDMSVTKLADAERYDSRADLRADLENGGP